MTKIINGRKFDVTITERTTWMYTISVYEIFSDGSFAFIGRAITNGIEKAIIEMVKEK